MTYKDIIANAKDNLGQFCKGCNICNGKACRNSIPGPGAKGTGDNAIRNFDKWQEIRLNMDTLYDSGAIDTTLSMFGQSFTIPVFAGPVGAVNLHYGDIYDDLQYNKLLVAGCERAGIAAFCGDGTNPKVMESACLAIKNSKGCGVPTVKPWNIDTIKEKIDLVSESGAFAVAMDIDAAGLPFLKNLNPPAGPKSVEDLKEIKALTNVPFIVKGIMTVKGALKAKEAGADAIVVSNHGGRVLDNVRSTCEVLEDICKAVGEDMIVLVDGGIRTGVDVFKALALGADGVMIARPFVTAVYGGKEEGVELYVEKIKSELIDAMTMCGAKNLSEISRDMIWTK